VLIDAYSSQGSAFADNSGWVSNTIGVLGIVVTVMHSF
jgi:hypothetical protein